MGEHAGGGSSFGKLVVGYCHAGGGLPYGSALGDGRAVVRGDVAAKQRRRLRYACRRGGGDRRGRPAHRGGGYGDRGVVVNAAGCADCGQGIGHEINIQHLACPNGNGSSGGNRVGCAACGGGKGADGGFGAPIDAILNIDRRASRCRTHLRNDAEAAHGKGHRGVARDV